MQDTEFKQEVPRQETAIKYSKRRKMLGSVCLISLITLFSRFFGFFRDMNTAAVFGMSHSPLMDAFILAFRIPHLFRRFYSEGILGIRYIPELTVFLQNSKTQINSDSNVDTNFESNSNFKSYSEQNLKVKTESEQKSETDIKKFQNISQKNFLKNETRNENRREFWTFVSSTMLGIVYLLLPLILIAEIICWIGMFSFPETGRVYLFCELSSILLPFVLFMTLSAQLGATLQTLNRFAVPALIPLILNIFWLAALLLTSDIGIYFPIRITLDLSSVLGFDLRAISDLHRCFFLSAAVVFSSFVQFSVQFLFLKRLDAVCRPNFKKYRPILRTVLGTTLLSALPLMSIQLCSLLVTGLAMLFSGNESSAISWFLWDDVVYPIRTGAVSALYFSEQLYEFPVGLLGIALGTVIYPILSRLSLERDRKLLAEELTFGIRVILFAAVPASFGLAALAEPVARLLYEHGEVSAQDTIRMSGLIFSFALGIWAFCLLPTLIRGFYVLKDVKTPLISCLISLIVCLVSSLVFIWFLQERGLALACSLAAGIQSIYLMVVFSRCYGKISVLKIVKTIGISLFSSGLMFFSVQKMLALISEHSVIADLERIGSGVLVGIIVYLLVGGGLLLIFERKKLRFLKRLPK